MKNNYPAWFTVIGLALIVYGLFSMYIALDILLRPQQTKNKAVPEDETITLAGNKIEYYDI